MRRLFLLLSFIDVANGAKGLKIFKNLGMDVRYSDGSRVRTDDPRLEPIWEKAGELGIPVASIAPGFPAIRRSYSGCLLPRRP